MKRFARWSPLFAVLAVAMIAAAPSKKSTNDAATPVATPSVPELLNVPASLNYQDMNVIQPTEYPDPNAPTAAASQGGNYAIDWYSINGGGTVNATSTNYKMGASIGQSVAGAATSTNYQMGIGFWYGAGGAGGCACDCHADPAPLGACDGVATVLDVTSLINVAFRGAAAILDPNGNCPFETTNVNCDGATTVLDVTLMINVAFRGADPATTFCNPCS